MSDSDLNTASHAQVSKRKFASEEKQSNKTDTSKRVKAEGTGAAKKVTTPVSLVQLRNGKLTLKQKAIEWSRSMSTLSTIIAFNTYLESCKEPLEDIPEDHLHMIAKLTQESDKSLNDVAKNIKNLVVPAADEDGESNENLSADQVLTLSSITKAVERVAARVNYGIDDQAAASCSSLQDFTVPPGLQIWRWEAKDVEQLAAESREKLLTRREERIVAKAQATQLLREMSIQERDALLKSKKSNKMNSVAKTEETAQLAPAAKIVPKAHEKTEQLEAAIVIDDDDDDDIDAKAESDSFLTPSPRKKPLVPSPSGSGTSKETSSRGASPTKAKSDMKKVALSPEQIAKLAEKEVKKRQRDLKRAEKEKKEAEKEAKKKREAQAKAKAVNFMSSFIQRPRSSSPEKPERKVVTLSDFDRTFLACTYKDVAPINRFRSSSTIDGSSRLGTMAVDDQSLNWLLQDFKAKCPQKKRNGLPSRKGIHPPISVRESMRLITEASVMGDEKLEENGKQGLSNLSDRTKVPMKLLHFASDRRPGWHGTWTRTTNLIGPRRPLGQDPVALDYSYDSDAEWEDEDPNDGDDLLDNDDKEEEDGERSDEDSEMDDWLVDDLEEEEEEEEGTAPPEDMDVFEMDPKGQAIASVPFKSINSVNAKPPGGLVNFLQPRKKKIKPIGRRFDSKLVPFSTGPHWQDNLGETSYDGFKGCQIEFLNDARPGLNPFTFESAELLPAGDVEATLFNRTLVAKCDEKTATGKAPNAPTSTGALAKAQSFPSQHLSNLLQTIEGNTSIRPVLVEDLKNKFAHLGKIVTKANIDACVNVYAEKLSKRMGAKWVIKEEYRSIAGVQEKVPAAATATITTTTTTTSTT